MSDADTLWLATKTAYEENILIGLTNPRKRSENAIDDARGLMAATAIVGLFPVYIQEDFDATSEAHLQVGIEGVIALLWKRGGTAPNADRVKWEDWEKMAQALKGVEPRAHAIPESTSNLSVPYADVTGAIPWAHRRNFRFLMPRVRGQNVYGGPDEWM